MDTFLGILAYVSIVVFIVSLIIYKRERSIFLQKISFMNRRITCENKSTFQIGNLNFDPTYKNNLDFVIIKESNMDNPDYAEVVKKFRLIVLTIRISLVLAALIFIVTTILP